MKPFHDYVITITKTVNTKFNEKLEVKKYLSVNEKGDFYQVDNLESALVFNNYTSAIHTAKKYKNRYCVFTDKVYPSRLEEEKSVGK